MDILLKDGDIVDPKGKVGEKKDILIHQGKIEKIDKNIEGKENWKVIDLKNEVVLPALFDIHTHLRTPGREDEENLYTGTLAALKGGFTRICCMPNTNPALDTGGLIKFIVKESQQYGGVEILPVGAITKAREGEELTEMQDLEEQGAVAFSDDGNAIVSSHIMRKALEYVKMLRGTIISHCEDVGLSKGGYVNEGKISTILGLKGIPKEAEVSMIERDIRLCKLTGSTVHIAHVSCKESLEAIRRAKREGVNVRCETCPHYFSLTEEAVLGFDTNAKVNPPLRTKEDVEAIKEGLFDGTIDAIVSDHAPHAIQEKELEFNQAPFGMIGLETSLSVAITYLIEEEILDWEKLVKLMSVNPAKIVNKEPFYIEEGKLANLTIVAMKKWTPESEDFNSLCRNTPFIGRPLTGKVDYVFNQGDLVVEKGEIKNIKEE